MIFTLSSNGLIGYIKIIPNASKNALGEILNIDNKNILKIYIKAPAVEGKANKALIDFFSEIFKIKKSSLRIKKGTTQKYKILEILCSQNYLMVQKTIEQKILLLMKK